MNAPDAAVGKSVKCPKCQTPVPVRAAKPAASPPPRRPAEDLPEDLPPRRRRPADDDEPDDRPRRKRKPQKSGAPVGLIVGLLAVALLGGGGFAAYWFGFRDKPQIAGPAGPADPPPAWKKAPTPDDWQVHNVEVCGCRAAFPAPPVEDVPTSQGTAAFQATGRMFRSPAGGFAASPSGVLCAVGRVTPPATIPADRRRQAGFQSFKSDAIEGLPAARVTGRRPAPVGGHPGEEVAIQTPPATAGGPVTYWVIRSAAVGDDVFVMAVWKEGEPIPKAIEDGFFDSLEVTGDAAWTVKKVNPPPPKSEPGPPAPKSEPKSEPSNVFLPTTTVAVEEKAPSEGPANFSLSADGGTVGVFGDGKRADGVRLHVSAFYDVTTGERNPAPIPLEGPGTIAAGGKTTAYCNTTADGRTYGMVVRDIPTGQQTRVANFDETVAASFSCAPSGRLLVIARNSKLRFQPWPAGGPPAPEVDAGSRVYGLSQVFQGGTRVAAVHYDTDDDVVVRVWDVKAGKAVKAVPLKRSRIVNGYPNELLQVAEDGKAMVAGTARRTETVWNLTTGERMTWWDAPSSRPPGTRLKPMTGGRILYADKGRKSLPAGGERDFRYVAVADLFSGGILHFLEYPPEVTDVTGVVVECTPDGSRVASLCPAAQKVFVWDLPK